MALNKHSWDSFTQGPTDKMNEVERDWHDLELRRAMEDILARHRSRGPDFIPELALKLYQEAKARQPQDSDKSRESVFNNGE